LASTVFLDLNQQRPELDDNAVFELVIKVAEGTLKVEQIGDHLRLFDVSE
jgi:hypothetical protein